MANNYRVRTLCNNGNYPQSHRRSQRNHVIPSRSPHLVLLLTLNRRDPHVAATNTACTKVT